MEELLVRTSKGTFLLRGTKRGLQSVVFPGSFRKTLVCQSRPISINSKKAAVRLQRYFKDPGTDFCDIALDLENVTDFQARILQVLSRLGRNKISYAALARICGCPGSARAIGMCMRLNPLPIVVPCHRVIMSNGHLGGFSQGLRWKRFLLGWEGLI